MQFLDILLNLRHEMEELRKRALLIFNPIAGEKRSLRLMPEVTSSSCKSELLVGVHAEIIIAIRSKITAKVNFFLFIRILPPIVIYTQ